MIRTTVIIRTRLDQDIVKLVLFHFSICIHISYFKTGKLNLITASLNVLRNCKVVQWIINNIFMYKK